MKRQLNIPFLAGLIVATMLIGASFYGLHAYQVKRSARGLLKMVERAAADGDRGTAVDRLERYLYYRPTDFEALVRLGNLLAPDPMTASPSDAQQAQRALERAILLKPNRDDIRLWCAELELRLISVPSPASEVILQKAKANLITILYHADPAPETDKLTDGDTSSDTRGDVLESKLARVPGLGRAKCLFGICLEYGKKYPLAGVCYEAARAADPTQIDAYTRQAYVLRSDLLKDVAPENSGKADAIMTAHLVKNATGEIVATGAEDGLIDRLGSEASVQKQLTADTAETSFLAQIAAQLAWTAAEEAVAAVQLAGQPPEGLDTSPPGAVEIAVREAAQTGIKLPRTTTLKEAVEIARTAAEGADKAANEANPDAAVKARAFADAAARAARRAGTAREEARRRLAALAHLERARYLLANRAAIAATTETTDSKAIDAALLHVASEDARTARGLQPDDVEVLLQSARLALISPEPDTKTARSFLEQVKTLQPTNVLMYQMLADIEQLEKHPDRAVQCLQEGIARLPKQSAGRALLLWYSAELRIQAGEIDKVGVLLDELKGEPKSDADRQPLVDPQLTALLEASIAMVEHKWYTAADLLERAAPELALKPEKQVGVLDRTRWAKKAFLMLGQCYERMNRPEQQYIAYRRAAEGTIPGESAESDTLNVQALLGVAQALVAQDKLNEAIEQYQKLVALPGTPPDVRVTIYTNLAQALTMRNLQLSESQRDWRDVNAVLDQARKVSEAANNESSLGRVVQLQTNVLLEQKRDEEAAKDIEAVLQRHPSLVELWVARAAILERTDPKAALAVLTEAEQKLGRKIELRAALARHWAPLLKVPAQAEAARQVLDGIEGEVQKLLEQAEATRKAKRPEDTAKADADTRRFFVALIDAYNRSGVEDRLRVLVAKAARAFPADLDLQLARFQQDLRDPDRKKGLTAAEADLKAIRAIDNEEEGTGDGTMIRYCEAYLGIEKIRPQFDPKNPQAVQAQAAEVEKWLAEIRQRRPDWPGLALLQGDVDYYQGRSTSAVENYQKAINAGNRSVVLIQRTTQLLLQLGRTAEADKLLQEIQTPGVALASSPDLKRLAATAALGVGDYERALKEARDAVTGDTKNVNDLVWFGQVLWLASRQAAADGRVEEAKGRRIEAEKVLRRAVELAGDLPAAWLILVRVLASSDPAKAKQALQEAEKHLLLPRNALTLAQCYEATGQDEQAYQMYHKALAAEPQNPAFQRALAEYCLRTAPTQPDRLKEAKDQLAWLKEQSPNQADRDWARQTLAVVTALTAAGGNNQRFLEAMKILGVTSDQESASPTDRRIRANILAARPNLSERRQATEILEKMAKQGIAQPNDLFLLAKLYETDKHWPQAREVLEKLLKDNTGAGTAPVLAYYVAALLKNGELNEAQVRLDELEKLAPGQIALRVRLLQKRNRIPEAARLLKDFARGDRRRLEPTATLLEELGQLDDAETMFRAIREQFPEEPTAVLPLAGFLGRHNRTGEALDLLGDDAWQKMPPERVSSACVIVLYSAAMDDQKLFNAQCERVAARIETAIQQYPDKPSLKFDLANLRSIQERYPDAEQIYREVAGSVRGASKDLNVSGAPLNNLAWLLALEGERVKCEEAERCVQEAMGIDGETPDLLDTRAMARLALDHTKEAIQDLEDAIAVSQSPDKNFHLARAYLKANRREEAESRFNMAREGGLKRSGLHPLERKAYDELTREFPPPK